MDKKLKGIFLTFIFIFTIFCGCQGTQVENEFVPVFNSDVANLVNYSIDFKKDREQKIVEVYVTGIIENKINRQINIIISVDFYDVNNDFLGKKNYTITGLRVKPNPGYTTTFSITYNEENSYKFDHVEISATEIK